MPAMRRLTVLLACLPLCGTLLVGCIQERGEILPADPRDYSDASFLTVPDDEDFWLAPLPTRYGGEPAELQVPRGGLWLKAGWINVESQCYTPKKAAHRTDYPIFPEYADAVPAYIQPGRRYLLSCDDYKVGKFGLTELARIDGF